jgi:hypothetical protein
MPPPSIDFRQEASRRGGAPPSREIDELCHFYITDIRASFCIICLLLLSMEPSIA